MKKNFIILYTEAGGGHKSAAKALASIIEENSEWETTLINPSKDLCSEFDLFKKFTNIDGETVYNKLVASREHSFFSLLFVSSILILNLAIYRAKIIRKLSAFWQTVNVDMVISVTPFINSLISESLEVTLPNVPFVTIPTDYSECAKNIWINGNRQFIVCGTQKLLAQALQLKHPKERIMQLSGMITRPAFYQIKVHDKQQALQQLGLSSDIPTGVVLFGSHASKAMLKIAEQFNNANYKIQLIFICGHDKKLKQQLEKLSLNYPALILGYVQDVQNYMAVADFFIGKPGGASVTEASIMHLPIILLSGPLTLLQERYNAKWVEENGLGICIKNFNNIANVAQQVLNDKAKYVAAYQKINNKGIFEVPQILQAIFNAYCSKIEQQPIPPAITRK